MIISPKYDYFVKELFHDTTVLRHFIGDVMGIPQERIRSVRLKNTFLRKGYRKQKEGILDVLAELNDDTKINIELQAKVCKDWDKRQLFYISRMYAEDLGAGEKYHDLKKCVGISILNFSLTDGEKYHTVYHLRDEEGNKLTDMFEVHILELNKKLTGQGEVEDWIRFFNIETEEDIKMLKTKNPGILKAIGVLQRLSMSNPMRLRYEAYLKKVRDDYAWRAYVREEAETEWREIGREEGRAEGREEGRAEGMAESVLVFLREYESVPDGLKTRILSEKDVEKLDQWVRIAARSQSIEEFRERAGIKTDR